MRIKMKFWVKGRHDFTTIMGVALLAILLLAGSISAETNPGNSFRVPAPQGFPQLDNAGFLKGMNAVPGPIAENDKFLRLKTNNKQEISRFPVQIQSQNQTDIFFTGNVTELWNESTNGDWTSSFQVADMDGDGLNDVLVNTGRYEPAAGTNNYTLMARRGTDGTHLWEESVSGNAWIYGTPAEDMSGDGLNDVLIYISRYDPVTGTNNNMLIAKRGTDGANLWEESVSGNAWIYGTPAGDMNGDGLNDTLVNIQRYDPATGTNNYTLAAKRGTDGTNLWEESVSGSAWISGTPEEDMNGDGLDDVLVQGYRYDPAAGTSNYTLAARRGTDGANLWEESVSGNGWTYGYTAGDMSGDGLNDVLVHVYRYDIATSTNNYTLTARKGTDGTQLWEESESGNVWMSGTPAGDMSGDGLNDTLVNIQRYDPVTGTNNYILAAKKGTDGSNLWEESISGNAWIYGTPTEDLSGDGLDDVLVNIQKYDSRNGTGNYTLAARRGNDGVTLWEESVNGSGWVSGAPAGDISGDGHSDVLVHTRRYDPVTGTNYYTLTARRGTDGANLWDESVSGNVWMYGNSAGDISGDGLNDTLVNIQRYDPVTGTNYYTVTARRGPDGLNLWEATSNTWIQTETGAANQTSDPDLNGDLNGDDINDVLISIYNKVYAVTTSETANNSSTIEGTKFNDSDGSGTREPDETGVAGVGIKLSRMIAPGDEPIAGYVSTDTDGSYRFTGLPPGFYKVEELPTNSMQTYPANGSPYIINLSAGEVRTGVDFGNQFVPPGEIRGMGFNDSDGDGVHDAGENGIQGINICISPVWRCTTTDASGTYIISNVAAGTYTVFEYLPSGYVATTPSMVTLTVNLSEVRTVDFGNRLPIPPPDDIGIVQQYGEQNGIPTVLRPGLTNLTIRKNLTNISSNVVAVNLTLTWSDGTTKRAGMTQIGTTNVWESTFTPPFPPGTAQMTFEVDVSPPGASPEDGIQIGDIIFIDPSGRIQDACTGVPISGAVVTLLVEYPSGTGNFIVSPAENQLPSDNPLATGEDGRYSWLTVPGTYKVMVEKTGYTAAESQPVNIPPPVFNLDISLMPTAGCPGQETTGNVTGGGWIVSPTVPEQKNNNKATFGFLAHYADGSPDGSLQYTDHVSGMEVHGDVTTLSVDRTTMTATFSGTAKVDGVEGYAYTVVVVDNGEPGRKDTFTISIPGKSYTASGTLGGGNIQIHDT